MNAQEERRVIEALQALTGGLTVTEHDTMEAQGRLRRALDEPPARRTRRMAVLAAAAAVLLVGTLAGLALSRGDRSPAPAEPPAHTDELLGRDDPFLAGPPPTRDQLLGLWQYRSTNADWGDEAAFTLNWQLKSNGTYTYDAEGVDGNGELINAKQMATIDGGEEQGAWSVGEGTLVIAAAGNGCTYTWGAALMTAGSAAPDGSLHLRLVSADGSDCPNLDTGTPGLALRRVDPDRDPTLDALRPPADDRFDPATDDRDVIGLWFRSGDPGALLLNPDHGFIYVPDGPTAGGSAVFGTWRLSGGRLVLTAAEGCTASEQLAVDGLLVGLGDAGPGYTRTVAWLKGSPSGSDCGAGYGSNWTWQRL